LAPPARTDRHNGANARGKKFLLLFSKKKAFLSVLPTHSAPKAITLSYLFLPKSLAHDPASANPDARALWRGYLAEVHTNSCHREVLRDVKDYWEILDRGGALIGDDCHAVWPGVVRAAGEFSARVCQPLSMEPPKWILQKP
jgi:hypothetical protein